MGNFFLIFFLFSFFSFHSPEARAEDSWSDIPILQSYYLEPQNLDDIETLVSNRWFEKAWEALKAYSEEDERVLYLKAATLMGLKQYPVSEQMFQKIASDTTDRTLRRKSKLMEAKVLARLALYSKAMDIYDELLESERNPSLYWTAFHTALESKDYERGLHYLRRFSGAKIFWWRGWCYFRLGEETHALNNWKLISKRDRKFYSQAQYWQAFLLDQLNEKKKSAAIFEELAEKFPLSYYGHLALKRLNLTPPSFENPYPKPYSAIVEKETKQRKLDSNLIFSLIKQESSFREEAVSPAGAIGVMQLMPQTALRLAKAAKLKTFDLREIVRPEVNIHLGCMYIQFLSELFSKSFPHILASYNAGEEAVSRWMISREKEPVEFFVEEIPYEETRNYIKRILGNYHALSVSN